MDDYKTKFGGGKATPRNCMYRLMWRFGLSYDTMSVARQLPCMGFYVER